MEMVLVQANQCLNIIYWLFFGFSRSGPLFIPCDFGLQNDFLPPIRVTLGLCTKIVLIWFHWRSFWAHEMGTHFSLSSVFDARNIFLPVAFPMMGLFLTWKVFVQVV
jgi:hypothetical protein